jgi:glycosyltransferase involved in cell wall biosynthesis
MKKPRVHLIARDIYKGDAIGNFVFELKRLLRSNGYKVIISAENFNSDIDLDINKLDDIKKHVRNDDVIFYNFSIYDPYLSDITKLDAKKILYFHGITPPELLCQYDVRTADLCQKGLRQLGSSEQFDAIVCNSNFSKHQLLNHCDNNAPGGIIHIHPPFISSIMGKQRFRSSKKEYADRLILLFVGRVTPHKQVEHLVDLLAEAKKKVPNTVLHIVGKAENEAYKKQIESRISEKHLKAQVDVIFKGYITDHELEQEYSEADFFVTLSLHEGFCVPLYEAMRYEIPIIACGYSAIAETLGETFTTFKPEQLEEMAEYIYSYYKYPYFRERNSENLKARCRQLSQMSSGDSFIAILNEMSIR